MLLRWLVNNYLRDAAEQAVRQTISDVTSPRAEQTVDAAAGDPANDEDLSCEIAVIYALGIEAGPLVDQLKDAASTRRPNLVEHAGSLANRLAVIAEGGVGQKSAAAATREIIRAYEPKWVISAGFAGSLSSEVQRGHLLMANSVINAAGEHLEIELRMQPQPRLHTGRLATVDSIIRTAEEKKSLGEKCHALACDMETFAVAQECARANTKFLSVRIISDGVDDELPKEVEQLLQEKNFAKQAGRAIQALMKRPSAALDLWKLRDEAHKAADRLAKFLLQVIPQLPT
jgi:adenosylhomocysteine nucleosidase